MGDYRTAVCDKCGSEANFVWHCPEGWYNGYIHNISVAFGDLGGVNGEGGMFCSPECLTLFVGSYFDAAKHQLLNRIATRKIAEMQIE